MASPKDLRYTRDHEWARLEKDGDVVVGVTGYAQEALGDVVFVELPGVGDELTAGQPFGVVESVKTVSDLMSPCDGEVTDVNEDLNDTPEKVNEDAYGEGWIVRARPDSTDFLETLMDGKAYDAYVEAEAS